MDIVFMVICFLTAFVLCGVITMVPNFLPDIPNSRSLHATVTPRGGGVSFAIPFLASLAVIAWFTKTWTHPSVIALFVGGILFAGIGLLDDAMGLPVVARLLFQVLVAGTLCATSLPANFTLPCAFFVTGWPAVLLQTFWVVAWINLFNFMDGMDGLAGAQAVFAAGFFSVLLYLDSTGAPADVRPIYAAVAAAAGCLSLAALGFLLWNVSPARLFMGDVGSYFLGFAFAFMGLMLPHSVRTGSGGFDIGFLFRGSARAHFDLVAILTALLPFLVDTLTTLSQRIAHGKNIFSAHKEHLYQMAYQAGYLPGKIVMGFGFLNALAVIVTVIRSYPMRDADALILIAGLAAAEVVVFLALRKRLSSRLFQAGTIS
ncbi:MAG: glycosyltransferase family 4 protein [Spirochaetia bacterium]|nr:glycosyltransferase family 4 protein [Spirochaetia bacterium]